MKKINIKAISIGILIDLLGSFVIGFILGLGIGIIKTVECAKIYNKKELITACVNNSVNSLPMMISFMIVGLVFTFIGSFVAGRIAKNHQELNGLMVAIIGILISLPLLFLSFSFSKIIYNIIALILTLGFGYLGGYASKKY